jgi:hypothetical protein
MIKVCEKRAGIGVMEVNFGDLPPFSLHLPKIRNGDFFPPIFIPPMVFRFLP